MDECFKCGVTGDKVRLYDAISKEGIVKICSHCMAGEDVPVIKKPTTGQLKEEEAKKSVYDRISGYGGTKFKGIASKEDISLRDLVDRKYNFEKQEDKKPRPDLIDNFHWVIMRARRKKKYTREQVAREIGEAEMAIKMAEDGILPEDDYKLINKLESYLGISLIRKEFENDIRPKINYGENLPRGGMSFDPATSKQLTIADLQELKRKKEESVLGERGDRGDDVEILEIDEPEEIGGGNIFEEGDLSREEVEQEIKNVKKDLSQEDIDKLIFGK